MLFKRECASRSLLGAVAYFEPVLEYLVKGDSMLCGQCAFENPDGMRFCGGCGQSLDPACAECGAPNPAGFRFCGSCGASLAATKPAATKLADTDKEDHAERRHMTVMFCDLVDSTAISEALDPEEYHLLVNGYQQEVANIADEWKGHLAQYLGDGVLLYFGFQRAQEDDAFRAVQAGMEIVQAIRRFSERMEREHGVRIRVRVGIHSGTVVSGEIGAGEKVERLALGIAPNIAARVQGLASPDEVLVSSSTLEVVGRTVMADSLGPHKLKGVTAPVEIFRVTGIRAVGEDHPDSELPFVGRDTELAELRARYAGVSSGHGHVVHVRGDAGIGKSRLLSEFKRSNSGQAQWLTCRCSAHHENVDLFPIVEMLKRRMGVRDTGSAETRLQDLEAWLAENWIADPGTVRALAAVLGLEDQSDARPVSRKQRFNAVMDWFYHSAERESLVVLIEDLHWADPSTLELLGLLAESLQDERVLLLYSARPNFSSPWEPRAYHSLIDLNRLAAEQARAVLECIVGDQLPESVCNKLIDRADGVPLYLEQLSKAALANMPEDGADLDRFVPNSLHDSLLARIDALGPAREVCQIGALLGRTFSYQMLRAATSHPREQLDDWIERVLDAGLLIRVGSGPRAVFRFRHSLIQDTAYDSMLKKRRRLLHGQAADAIIERFPDMAKSEPDILAGHLDGAGRWAEAVDAYGRAGAGQTARGAFIEAIRSYQKGLSLIPRLPESAERDEAEYQLLRDLQSPMHARSGYGTAEMPPLLARMTELLSRKDDPESEYRLLMADWGYHCMRGNRVETQHLSDALQAFAEKSPPTTLVSGAMFSVGSNHFYRGEFAPAGQYLQKSIDLSCEGIQWGKRSQDLNHPAFLARLVMGSCLSITGHPDSGRTMIEKTLAVARHQNLPFAIVQCLTWLAFCEVDIERDPVELMEMAEEQSRTARDHEMDSWNANLLRLCSELRLEKPEAPAAAAKALRRMQRNTIVTTGYMCTQLGDSLVAAGELKTAQEAVATAFAVAEHNLGTMHLPETHRVQGLLLAAENEDKEGIAHLEQSIELNRGCGSALYELKSHADLHEHYPAAARAHRPRFKELLEGIGEGEDTPLLRRISGLVS